MKELLNSTDTGDNEVLSEWDSLANDSYEKNEDETMLGDNAQLLAEMLSPDGIDRFKQEIESEISDSPALAHMRQIDIESDRARAQFIDDNDRIIIEKEDEFFAVSDHYRDRMEFARKLWGEDASSRYKHLMRELESIEEKSVALFGADGRELLEHLIQNSPEKPAHAAHIFVPTEILKTEQQKSEGKEVSISFNSNHDVVDIPLNYFISAESMDSWYGRGALGQGGKISKLSEKNQTSLETIEEYADAETAPPPVELLRGYVLPDGRIYFNSGNAHRVAAAIRRGDESIQFNGSARISLLDHIPPELASSTT